MSNEILMTKDGAVRPVIESAFDAVWADRGWTKVEDERTPVTPAVQDLDGREPRTVATAPETPSGAHPARNASTEDWQTYAEAQGMAPADAAEMGRDELVEHFLGTG